MLNCIYDVFLTSDKNNCTDLFLVALPMFLSDVQKHTREYVSDETDINKWHDHVNELNAATTEIREFIGRHYNKLVDAFKLRNRAEFDSVVAECVKADEEAAKAKEEQDEA